MDIVKISVVIAIVGIVSLFFISTIFAEEATDISDLKIGQMERVNGMVTSIYVSRDSHVFLNVADKTGDIDVVAFKSSNIDLAYDLEVGDEISVMGRVEEYQGDLEIIAKEISKI